LLVAISNDTAKLLETPKVFDTKGAMKIATGQEYNLGIVKIQRMQQWTISSKVPKVINISI
jgi:hypothetical protein